MTAIAGTEGTGHPPVFTDLQLSDTPLETQMLIAKAVMGRTKLRNFLELMLWSYHRLCYSYLPLQNLPSLLGEHVHGIKIFHQPWVLVISLEQNTESCKVFCTAVHQIPLVNTDMSLSVSSKHPKRFKTNKPDWYPASFVKRLHMI